MMKNPDSRRMMVLAEQLLSEAEACAHGTAYERAAALTDLARAYVAAAEAEAMLATAEAMAHLLYVRADRIEMGEESPDETLDS